MPTAGERARRAWRTLFSIDLRTLALFRVAIALCVLADLALRARDLSAFYTDDGILSRAEAVRIWGGPYGHGVFELTGSTAGVAALFVLFGIAGLALLVGFYTRIAAVLCLVCVHGFVLRNPLVLNGGDLLLVALLLWAAFLPLGARASIDAARAPPPPDDGAPPAVAVLDAATAVLLLQVAFVVVFAGSAKMADRTWMQGDGVYYALTAELYTTELAHWLATLPWLLPVLNWGVVFFELLGPAMLLSPWKNHVFRLAFALIYIAMNVMFAMCLRVGLFSWVAIASATIFVPTETWEWLVPRVQRLRRAGARVAAWCARWPSRRRPRLHAPRPLQAVAVVLFAIVMIGNLSAKRQMRFELPRPIADVLSALGLDQRGWPMFSPVARDHGWFVFRGELAGGDEVDLWKHGAPVDYTRPALLSDEVRNYRWRKLLMILKRGPAFRLHVARYLCRDWNGSHDGARRVVSVELVYMREETLPDHQVEPARRVSLLHHRCRE